MCLNLQIAYKYHIQANFFAQATQTITAMVTINIATLTCSFNRTAAIASPKIG
ncbi:DUF2135 domain-containing protein [Acinetobacter venetianus]|uniref:DUF2135 domain-containing protein n=1 Tax=Acinetobacter venetianus TaxID=52133 RepID=UPI0039C89941